MWGIGLDWVTGDLFDISRNGYVFVCKPRDAASGTWMCKTLLSSPGGLEGIAVNPNTGYDMMLLMVAIQVAFHNHFLAFYFDFIIGRFIGPNCAA